MNDLKQLLKTFSDDTLLVTPTVTAKLLEGEEFVLDRVHADRLAEVMSATPRERHSSFSSSSRGQCERRQVLAFLGEEQTRSVAARLRLIFLDGHYRHLRWQAMLLQWGVIDQIEYGFHSPFYQVTGSLDGANTKDDWGWELKGINSFGYSQVAKWGPTEAHLMQAHTYMLVTGFSRFSLVYENKDTQDYREFVLYKDDSTTALVEAELQRLHDAVETQTLPEMLDACQTTPKEDCPYRDQCPTATWAETEARATALRNANPGPSSG